METPWLTIWNWRLRRPRCLTGAEHDKQVALRQAAMSFLKIGATRHKAGRQCQSERGRAMWGDQCAARESLQRKTEVPNFNMMAARS